jgi:chromosomal replication initiation ATPase DnaA
MRQQEAHVLITARIAPAQWRVELPDLASRLRAMPVVELSAPDDALLRAVLVKLFADRQLVVDESLIAYLATRIERSFAGARAAGRRARSRGAQAEAAGHARSGGGAAFASVNQMIAAAVTAPSAP